MIAEPKQQDPLANHPGYAIKLPAFEGPLDLLLFLVRKHEVDIYDIPIHTVTRQYLQILNDMQRLNLEVAGEFFVMAATLMQIKSSMLLPKDEQLVQEEEEEEGTDPRWQLVQQLLEYKNFKEAAGGLETLVYQQQDYIPRHYQENREDKLTAPLRQSDKIQLWNTFNIVLRRLAEQMIGSGEIHDEQVTVADRMEFILTSIQDKDHVSFTHLFVKGDTLTHIVATFLAILELTRLKQVTIKQEKNFTDIHISRVKQTVPLPSDELADD